MKHLCFTSLTPLNLISGWSDYCPAVWLKSALSLAFPETLYQIVGYNSPFISERNFAVCCSWGQSLFYHPQSSGQTHLALRPGYFPLDLRLVPLGHSCFRSTAPSYHPGQRVRLAARHLLLMIKSRKTGSSYHGTFSHLYGNQSSSRPALSSSLHEDQPPLSMCSVSKL